MKKSYTTIKIEDRDHQVMKDVKKLTGMPITRQITDCLKKEYPNMYKES